VCVSETATETLLYCRLCAESNIISIYGACRCKVCNAFFTGAHAGILECQQQQATQTNTKIVVEENQNFSYNYSEQSLKCERRREREREGEGTELGLRAQEP